MSLLNRAVKAVSDQFWAPRFWLPGNTTWEDLISRPNMPLPATSDLWLGLYIATFLLVARFLFERWVATPIALASGLPPRRHLDPPPPLHPLLDAAFARARRRPDADTIAALSKRTDLPQRRVASWFRLALRARRSRVKPQEIDKFNESSWRFAFYLGIFIYGLVVLWDKPWFSDTKHCWVGWPDNIPLDDELRWYYMMEIGFYTSLFVSQFFDVQRKDFWQMFTHHLATLTLLTASWITNMVRIGSLVLVIHDAVDWLLEISKMTNYAKMDRLCEICFVAFASVWFASRLVYFPLVVIKSCLFEATATMEAMGLDVRISLTGGVGGVYFLFNGLLILLYCLHWFWFYHIMYMAYKLVRHGKVGKDARSETEGSDEDEDEDDASRANGDGVGVGVGKTSLPNGTDCNGIAVRKRVNQES